jgi:hypothetical protein
MGIFFPSNSFEIQFPSWDIWIDVFQFLRNISIGVHVMTLWTGLGTQKLFVDAQKYHICYVCLVWKLNFGLMSVSYFDDFNHNSHWPVPCQTQHNHNTRQTQLGDSGRQTHPTNTLNRMGRASKPTLRPCQPSDHVSNANTITLIHSPARWLKPVVHQTSRNPFSIIIENFTK